MNIINKILNRKIEKITKRILDEEVQKLKETNQMFLKKITPQGMLSYMTICLCEHCNLNCARCDHFSPVAEEKFYQTSELEKDLKRLNELTEGDIKKIALEGGEPLLHFDIVKCIQIVRNYFKNSDISILTNGILLDKMPDEFFEAAKSNNITIEITQYPINLDYSSIEKNMAQKGVNLKYYFSGDKDSHKCPLDVKGEGDARENFLNCWHANNCVCLKEGKLYTCTVAPFIEHFNKHFNLDLKLTKNDGIDIHNAKSMNEILSFLSNPIPFCRFCDVKNRSFGHKWHVSKKEITEWT